MGLPLPYSLHYYVKKLLPRIDEWRQERNSKFGDKSMLCDRFLNEIVLYLVEVFIQDGIYFIKKFPQHLMTKVLVVSTKPTY